MHLSEMKGRPWIGSMALVLTKYIIASYEEDWQREEGEPEIERTTDIAHAVETFFDLCGVILCVELRGVDLDGSEYPVCIGGTAPDLSEEGEYIKE